MGTVEGVLAHLRRPAATLDGLRPGFAGEDVRGYQEVQRGVAGRGCGDLLELAAELMQPLGLASAGRRGSGGLPFRPVLPECIPVSLVALVLLVYSINKRRAEILTT